MLWSTHLPWGFLIFSSLCYTSVCVRACVCVHAAYHSKHVKSTGITFAVWVDEMGPLKTTFKDKICLSFFQKHIKSTLSFFNVFIFCPLFEEKWWTCLKNFEYFVFLKQGSSTVLCVCHVSQLLSNIKPGCFVFSTKDGIASLFLKSLVPSCKVILERKFFKK